MHTYTNPIDAQLDGLVVEFLGYQISRYEMLLLRTALFAFLASRGFATFNFITQYDLINEWMLNYLLTGEMYLPA